MSHAKLSPSSSHRWLHCPGSVVLSEGLPSTHSAFAAEGTAAHYVAAMCLSEGKEAYDFVGSRVVVPITNHQEYFLEPTDEAAEGDYVIDITNDMSVYVQEYVDYIRSIGGELAIEQKLSLSSLTKEEGATGTSDSVIVANGELVIVDLKYGRGVKVYAANNPQLQIYALAALLELELVHDFNQVRIVVHQPRLSHVDEWTCSPEDLHKFGEEVTQGAYRVQNAFEQAGQLETWSEAFLNPNEDACRFCPVKAECPALTKHVLNTVADDFVDIQEPIAPRLENAALRTMDNKVLGNLMAAIPLIENWCKAIRAKTEAELFAGHEVPGFKLVEGRRGPRAWQNADDVENVLKSMRLKTEDMYDMKLISPTTAEKLHKVGTIGPRQWPRLQEFITQSEGQPSVAPEADKRPALVLTAVEDDFENETQEHEIHDLV